MNKNLTGYCIRVNDRENTLAAVTPLEPGLWQVDDLVLAKGGTMPSQNLVNTMARNGDNLTWLMPNELAEGSVMKLPSLKGKELGRAVMGTIARQEKAQAEDFFISWQALPAPKGGTGAGQQVFALHARKSDIAEQLDHHLAHATAPRRLLPPFLVLDEFFRFTRCDPLEDNTWNLVFLGEHENFLVVGNHDSVILTRPLPFDLGDGEPDEQYLNRLATEIERSGFFIKQGDLGQGMDRTLVAGDHKLANRLVAVLGERSGVPAEAWDIARNFQWSQREPIPDSALIPLMAAAMVRHPGPYNLLPSVGRTWFGPQARRRTLVAATTLGTALLPVLIIGSTVTAKVQESYLQRATQRLETARQEAAQAADIYTQQKVLNTQQDFLVRYRQDRPDLEQVLVQVGTMAPREILLKNLKISQDDLGKTRLTIVGQSEAPTSSQAHAAFLRFQDALDQAPFLEKYTEPLQLEISGDDLAEQEHPRTLFKMKYILAGATAGKERGENDI